MMSNEIERYLEAQDEIAAAAFLQTNGDELTDILVAALEEAFELLQIEHMGDTFH